jgi:hypothetical protein
MIEPNSAILTEQPPLPPPASSRIQAIATLLGLFLIGFLALYQAMGFCQPLEQSIFRHLPMALMQESPRVILITLENTPRGYHAMDVAMVLRGLGGLGNLHPRSVLVNGRIEPEEGPVHFLPDLISRFKSLPEIQMIVPQAPSPSALFQFVPLIRYSFHSKTNDWFTIEGKSIPGAGDATILSLPQIEGEDLYRLPLFAKTTTDDSPVGSLWWWALPGDFHRHPPLLLLGSILVLSNHSVLHLSPQAEFKPSSEGSIQEMALDDYLLAIEQKEQGTISPTFDSLWNNATVILGTHHDAAKATALAALLQEIAWGHLSLPIQMMMALMCALIFLFSKKLTLMKQWIFAFLFFSIIIGTTLILLHHRIIFPFLPGICTALLLPLKGCLNIPRTARRERLEEIAEF